MVYRVKKKNFLFIEPCLSCQFFFHQAKIKGYGIFVIAVNDTYLGDVDASAFFQIDTHNEESVLNLVKQLAEKFKFERVIMGSGCCEQLVVSVSTYLKRAGFSPSAYLHIQKSV